MSLNTLDSEICGHALLYLDTADLLSLRATARKYWKLFVSSGHSLNHIRRLSCDALKCANLLAAMGKVFDSSTFQSTLPSKNIHLTCMSIAHKGASSKFQGNTIPAFHEAVRIGSEMIELDIILCKTGNILVHHDPFLPDGELVGEKSMSEIRSKFPEIPTLQETLDALKESAIRIYFDLKCPLIIEPLLSALQRAVETCGWSPGRFLIASFDQHDLLHVNAFKEAHGIEFETIVIVDSMPLGYAACFSELQVNYISIAQGRIIPEFIEDAHRRGMGVIAWTVNNQNLWREFVQMGIDGIVTDFPEEFQQARISFSDSKNHVEDQSSPKEISIANFYPEEFHNVRKRALKVLHAAIPILKLCKKHNFELVQSHILDKLETSTSKCQEMCSRHLHPFLVSESSFKKFIDIMVTFQHDEGDSLTVSSFLLEFERDWLQSLSSKGIPIRFSSNA